MSGSGVTSAIPQVGYGTPSRYSIQHVMTSGSTGGSWCHWRVPVFGVQPAVGVPLGVNVGVSVQIGVGVGVRVGLAVGVFVAVAVAVRVGVDVGVAVPVCVGVGPQHAWSASVPGVVQGIDHAGGVPGVA